MSDEKDIDKEQAKIEGVKPYPLMKMSIKI